MEKLNIKIVFSVGDIPCEMVLPMTQSNAEALKQFKSGSELDLHKTGYRAAKRVTKIISQVYLLMNTDRDAADFDFEVKDV